LLVDKYAPLKSRTKKFALQIIEFVDDLPRNRVCDHIGRQLLRCGTSVAANYRAACRGKSTADFIAKMGIVEEEADECCFWLELLIESKRISPKNAEILKAEATELLSITVQSIKTARQRRA
jgi:four helix bundle protein